jgi:aminoglycoside adenylyltransferase-like protein
MSSSAACRYPAAVVGIAVEKLPSSARTAWLALRDELLNIVGDDLVAMWAYGGTTAVDDPAHAGDLDTYVVLSRRPDQVTTEAIEEAQNAIARAHGVEWDAWYVLADAARSADPPRHAWREGRRDTAWAINRALWLAGRYASLHGADPPELVQVPTQEGLEGDLSRELEHIERHVVEGDNDPYEATYAMLNGSRILHSVETNSVAISKRAAGTWALAHLPAPWHPALSAAVRTYEGRPADSDAALLAAEMAPFVAYVRERMPAVDDRPADALPRWSGY